MKTFGVIVAVIATFVVVGVVGMGIRAVMLPVHEISNVIDTGHDMIDKTINADNAIYNYEWFKQTWEDIQAIENKVKVSERQIADFKDTFGEASTWGFEVSNEYNRLQATKQGQMSQLEDVMAKYNARSKMANRNLFQDGLIPDMISIGGNILK